MEKEKWTLEEWKQNCAVNCTNSYSMAVNFAALCIHEYGEEEGLKCVRGLSGAQAEYAISLSKKIPGILDQNKMPTK